MQEQFLHSIGAIHLGLPLIFLPKLRLNAASLSIYLTDFQSEALKEFA